MTSAALPRLDRSMAPTLLRGGHRQTLAGRMLAILAIEALPEPDERVHIRLDDGDALAVRLYSPKPQKGQELDATGAAPVVFLFHGLGGSADSSYIQVCGKVSIEMGLTTVLVNLRNAAEGLTLARGLYHSGSAPDLAQVLSWGRDRWPARPLIACGFSLSANLVLNLASGRALWRCPTQADATLAVNPPIDLAQVAREIVRLDNLVYDQSFVANLKTLVREKVRLGHLPCEPKWPRMMRLTDFDDLVTAPAAGYRSRHDYYADCSSRDHLFKIDRPSLILMPEDDPFIPMSAFHSTRLSASTRLHLVETGGHLGYLAAGRGLSPRRWLGEFFASAMTQLQADLPPRLAAAPESRGLAPTRTESDKSNQPKEKR